MQEGQKVALEEPSGGMQLRMSVAQAGETCRRISCPNLWVPSYKHSPPHGYRFHVHCWSLVKNKVNRGLVWSFRAKRELGALFSSTFHLEQEFSPQDPWQRAQTSSSTQTQE